MVTIYTHRNNIAREREELAKHSSVRVKENAKILALGSKTLLARYSISRTKSVSAVRSKISEIERAEKFLAGTDKFVTDHCYWPIHNENKPSSSDIDSAVLLRNSGMMGNTDQQYLS